jgi:hypothetical protein
MDIVVQARTAGFPRLQGLTREKVQKIARFTHDAGNVESTIRVHTARRRPTAL